MVVLKLECFSEIIIQQLKGDSRLLAVAREPLARCVDSFFDGVLLAIYAAPERSFPMTADTYPLPGVIFYPETDGQTMTESDPTRDYLGDLWKTISQWWAEPTLP